MSHPAENALGIDVTEMTIDSPPVTSESLENTLADKTVQEQENGSGVSLRAFGNYDLLAEVARGGMGVVYKARQRSLERTVALKMILSGQLATDTDVQRFQREARAAAQLDHPNIVPIYEIGQHEGQHYFAMAFIEGDSLSQRIRTKGLLPWSESALLLQAVAEAIQYAHERGFIHRDLKPDNILLDSQGRPRITDFGLARGLDGESSLTATGQLMGTPSYMAPEQALGGKRAIGPAADIYALGGCLYFLLTGRPPFGGDSLTETLLQVVRDEPVPPSQLNPGVPAELEAICLKCLQKDPDQRYASAAQLADALRTLLSQATLPSAPAGDFLPGQTPSCQEIETLSGAPPGIDLGLSAAPPARSRSSWMRPVLLGGGLATLVLIGFVVALLFRRGPVPGQSAGDPSDRTGGTTSAALADELKKPAPDPGSNPKADGFVKPQQLRQDFGLKLEILGSTPGQADERRLQAGAKVRFRVEVQRDAYVGIWAIEPGGNVIQIFPNLYETEHLLRAGKASLVPGKESYAIVATPSQGLEHVWAVASTVPWDPLSGKREGPYLLFHSAEQKAQWKETLRALVLKPEVQAPTAAAVTEAILPYKVLPR